MMTEAVIAVEFAGPHVSFQDSGRAGYKRFGAPASGPMDRFALAAANRALGNPAGQTCIEISLGGLTLQCRQGSVSFAIAGGGFTVEHGDRICSSWQTGTLAEGERLVIRPGRWGSWTYLAFAGRLETPTWLGSAATHAGSGLGGGRLVAGQQWTIRDARRSDPVAIACPVFARPRRLVNVVLGPQERFFSQDVIDTLLTAHFRLTDAYDRMGVRLSGPDLAPRAPLDMPSEPIQRGSIQVAGDGVATVLLADHQTTGGYPKIATVLDSDLDGFVQLRPREAVMFRAISPARAIRLARWRAEVAKRYFGALTKGPNR